MTSSQSPLRVAIIGTGQRSDHLYGPILRALQKDVALVAVWGRNQASARQLGESLATPWYTNIERLVRETGAEIGIVSVAYDANGEVGLMAVEHGLHVLLETPIAHRLSEADAIIEAAATRGLKIEVAEQFFRRPLEQIKLKLIQAGIFGRVYTASNDFAGHGYHGVSVMRSYLGFDAQPLSVTGAVRQFPLTAHWSRLDDTRGPRTETQEHGIITFAEDKLGLYHWTSVAYDSALRWWRSSRFLAEKGMGLTTGVYPHVTEELSLLAPGGEAPQFITLERRTERNDGGALVALVAHTGDPARPMVTWENPFRPARKGHGWQWHDDEIGVASCVMSLVDAVRHDSEPSYGAQQARLDQEIITAIHQSSAMGGETIQLPLDAAQQFV